MWYRHIIDRGVVPDAILRSFVRYGLGKYSRNVGKLTDAQLQAYRDDFLDRSISSSIAVDTDKANRQHYDLPTEVFSTVCGESMKYSGSIWDNGIHTLDAADNRTIKTYLERADVADGQTILDLGCGWGSLSLYLAEHYPGSLITAVTNSATQKEFIESECRQKKISNLGVLKSDVNDLSFASTFDRIFAIEMLEHTRNVGQLFNRVATWMSDSSRFFVQVFSHQKYPQYFDDVENSWMARYFFTGGMMPYLDLYKDIDSRLCPVETWVESGEHYHKSLESWLRNLDANSTSLRASLDAYQLADTTSTLVNRFRFFLIICSELFRYNRGNDWVVVNHLFRKV